MRGYGKMVELECEVERLYNEGVLVKDIMRTLNLHDGAFYAIVRKLKAEGRLILRTPGQRKWGNQYKTHPRYYSWNVHTQHFSIVYKHRYYGCVKTANQAERFVELMKECDWDYGMRDEVKRKVMNE